MTDLFKELYAAYPNNVSFKNGLAISYIKLGPVYEKKGDKASAIAYYKLSAELLVQLVKRAPHYVEFHLSARTQAIGAKMNAEIWPVKLMNLNRKADFVIR